MCFALFLCACAGVALFFLMSYMSTVEDIHRIQDVVSSTPYSVRLVWENDVVVVDLAERLRKGKWFAPVLESDEVWKSVHVDEYG